MDSVSFVKPELGVSSHDRRIFGSSGLIVVLSGLTLFLGFIFQAVLASILGTGREMDIFLVAVTLPTLIAVSAQYTFPSVLVPFMKSRNWNETQNDGLGVHRIIVILVGSFGGLIVLVIILAANIIIRIAAPGFDPVSVNEVATLLRIMVIGSLFDILRGVLTADYYAQEKFFLPQIAPVLKHLIMISAAIILVGSFGLKGLAWGWTVGSFAMVAILVPNILNGKRWKLPREKNIKHLSALLVLLLPALVVAILSQMLPIVDRIVASTLAVGSISYLGYGYKMLEIMMRTIPMGIVLALFPIISQQAARRNWLKFSETILIGSRRLILFGFPIAVGVVLLREPIIFLLFERGAFDSNATINVANTLKWYALAFIPASLVYFLNHVFFSLKKWWFLAKLGLANLIFTATLNVLISRNYDFIGIAITNLAVSLIILVIMIVTLKRSDLNLGRDFELRWFGPVILATLIMGGFMIYTHESLNSLAVSYIQSMYLMLATLLAGALSYISSLLLFRNPEIEEVVSWFRNRQFSFRFFQRTEKERNEDRQEGQSELNIGLKDLFLFNSRLGIIPFLGGIPYFRFIEYPKAIEMAGDLEGKSILDIGSGRRGRFPLFLLSRVSDSKIIATDIIDYTDDHIPLVRKLGASELIGERFFTEQQDATSLKYPNRSFDRIFAISTLEHIPDEGDTAAIKEISRVLRSDGIAVISIPFNPSGYEMIYRDTDVEGKTHQDPVFFERQYDRESLYRRLIIPSELELKEVVFFGEHRFRFWEKFYSKIIVLPIYLQWLTIPFRILLPLFSKLFLSILKEGDLSVDGVVLSLEHPHIEQQKLRE